MNTKTLTRRQALKVAGVGIASATALSMPLKVMAQSRPGIAGQMAPELEVPYWIDGKGNPTEAFSVMANRDKWVILKCFQNWCPGCHSAGFPALQKIVGEFGNDNRVAIAAIQTTFEGFSTNTQDALLTNQQRYQLDIPFGHDQGDASAAHGDISRRPKTMISYRTGGTPWIVVVSPGGQVVYNHFHVNADKLIEVLHEELG